jgi:antitoxin CptB
MGALNKIRWQCRRGTLELDILLEHYLETGYPTADELEKSAFVELLALEDSELLPYLIGDRLPIAENVLALVNKIRNVAASKV